MDGNRMFGIIFLGLTSFYSLFTSFYYGFLFFSCIFITALIYIQKDVNRLKFVERKIKQEEDINRLIERDYPSLSKRKKC